MKNWCVRLTGNEHALHLLAEQNGGPHWSVIRENDEYLLQSSAFDALDDAQTVRQTAKTIIERLNGLAKLEFDTFKPVEIAGISHLDEQGNEHHHLFLDSVVTASATVGMPTLVAYNADGTKIPPTPQPPSIIETGYPIAINDNNVADTLRIWGERETNWINLYKILEIIQDDVGGEKQLLRTGWLSRGSLKRFTNTAQRSDLLGDEARHARSKGAPSANPMTLPEAKTLIKTTLHRWITTKAAQCSRDFQSRSPG